MKRKIGLEQLVVSEATGQLIRCGKKHMIEEPLQKIIDGCCDRNEIRADQRIEVQMQCETIWTLCCLFELLKSGEMEICGIHDGELQWKCTPHGKEKAREMVRRLHGG